MGGVPDIRQRSYDFAVRVVRFVRSLPNSVGCRELGTHLLKSGTSIGANTEEASGGFSKKDFAYKMSIAYREARETNYWLRLLRDSGLSNSPELEYLTKESAEIKMILGSIVKTSKEGSRGKRRS